jgi:hypothetical protein
MSEHKTTALQCVSGHCDFTRNKKIDALAKKAPVLSHKLQTGRYQTVLSEPESKGTSGG